MSRLWVWVDDPHLSQAKDSARPAVRDNHDELLQAEIKARVANDLKLRSLLEHEYSQFGMTASPLRRLADKMVRFLGGTRGDSYITPPGTAPHAAFAEPTIQFESPQYQRHQLIRFAMNMALIDGCPPELVADQIANSVRQAILERWRDQSILSAHV